MRRLWPTLLAVTALVALSAAGCSSEPAYSVPRMEVPVPATDSDGTKWEWAFEPDDDPPLELPVRVSKGEASHRIQLGDILTLRGVEYRYEAGTYEGEKHTGSITLVRVGAEAQGMNPGDEAALEEEVAKKEAALRVVDLPARWDEAVRLVAPHPEDPYVLPYVRLSGRDDSLNLLYIWGDLHGEHVRLEGSADRNHGLVRDLLISGSAETPWTDAKLEMLRPYFDLLIAATNPALGASERARILEDLGLLGVDAAEAAEAARTRSASVTVNWVTYSVDMLGSDLGGSLALIATWE